MNRTRWTTRLVPPTLREYRASWLSRDVTAGLALVALAVPEQIATAGLVGMPAIVGLDAFVAGSLLFALLGRHRQMSVGADSTIAPILAAGVGVLAVAGTPHYGPLMSLLAVMVGVLLVSVGVCRLGWIREFLSAPAITGILAGIGIAIMVHQIPVALGLVGGATTTVDRLVTVAAQLGRVNPWTAGIAAGTLAVLVLSEQMGRRVPGALVALVASTAAVVVLDLRSHGVAVVGPIDPTAPAFRGLTVDWADFIGLIGPALTVAFVCVVQTAAVERGTGGGTESTSVFELDLLALGAGNIVAGLTGSFAVNASPPRTEVLRTSGGHSQLAGVVAAVVAGGIGLLATGVLAQLPQATLAAVLIFVAAKMLRPRELLAVLRFDPLEFIWAVTTLLVVAFVGIEQGVVAAMLLSLAARTYRAARPNDAILGREPGTDHWVPSDIGRDVEHIPGVVVYQVFAPLWYGNADYVRLRIREVLASAAVPMRALVFDLSGMSDIDYTGARMLGQLARELRMRGITLAIARSSHLVHHDMAHSGLLTEIGSDHLHASIQEAIDALV